MKKLLWMLLLSFTIEVHAAVPLKQSTSAFIDLLVWQVRESGADNWAQLITPPGRQRSAKLIDASFDWNTGIRMGVGHEFSQRCFDLILTYTHYQTSASNQAAGIVFSAFVANYFANNTNGANFGPTYHSASIRWQIFYNTIDLNLGRNFNLDPVLQLHPYLGLKAASIHQNIFTNWLNPTTPTNFTSATEDLQNNFWGVGPAIGVDTTWPIYTSRCQSINLIGNIAVALLWGHWRFNEVYANNSPLHITVNVNDVNGAAPMTGGLLALQWIYHLTKSNISMRLGYEAQIWFNQLQFYSLNMGRLNRPISFQGGDLEISFSF